MGRRDVVPRRIAGGYRRLISRAADDLAGELKPNTTHRPTSTDAVINHGTRIIKGNTNKSVAIGEI
jgi:hypothetical protein